MNWPEVVQCSVVRKVEMPPSPALRCSPGRELPGKKHRRGHSIEYGILFRDQDDDLALFSEMQDKERDSFLLQSSDDLEDAFCKLFLLASNQDIFSLIWV